MEGHIARIERDAEAAELMITSARSYLEAKPANLNVFPQLDRELLLNKAAAIRNEKQDAIDLVTGILAEHRRISRDLGSELVASLTENLRNDEETGFQDDGQHLALGGQEVREPVVPRPMGTETLERDRLGLADLHTAQPSPVAQTNLRDELKQAESQERRRRRQGGEGTTSLVKAVMDSLRSGVGVLRGRSPSRALLPPAFPGGRLDKQKRSRSEPSVSARTSVEVTPNVSPESNTPEGAQGDLTAQIQQL